MSCPHCSNKIDPEDRFCSRCGQPLGNRRPILSNDIPRGEFRSPEKPSSSRGKILALLMVTTLGAAGYYYFWQPRRQKDQTLGRPLESVKIIPPPTTHMTPGQGLGGFVGFPDSTREPEEGYFVDQFEEMLRDESDMRHGTGFYDNSSPDDYIDVIIGHIKYTCHSEAGETLPDSASFSLDVAKDGTVSGNLTLPALTTLITGTLSDSGVLDVHGRKEAVECRIRGHMDTRTMNTGFISGDGNFSLTDSSAGSVSLCDGEWSTLE